MVYTNNNRLIVQQCVCSRVLANFETRCVCCTFRFQSIFALTTSDKLQLRLWIFDLETDLSFSGSLLGHRSSVTTNDFDNATAMYSREIYSDVLSAFYAELT